MTKIFKAISLGIIILFSFQGCSTIYNMFHKKPEPSMVWWGTKDEIIMFLDQNDKGTGEEWYIERMK